MNDVDKDWILKYLEKINELRDENLRSYKEDVQKALLLERQQMEMRLEKLNELRAEVIRDRSSFVSIPRYDALDERVKSLEKVAAKILGLAIAYGLIVGAIGAIIGAVISKLVK